MKKRSKGVSTLLANPEIFAGFVLLSCYGASGTQRWKATSRTPRWGLWNGAINCVSNGTAQD